MKTITLKMRMTLAAKKRKECRVLHANSQSHFLTSLTAGLTLLAGSARLSAGPAPAFPLEPAFGLAADAQPEPEPVPLRWVGGCVLAKVTINGANAGWFMIATGWATSFIDPQVAARLKLTVVSDCGLMTGFMGDRGSGKNTRFRADVLQCGAATATDVHLAPYNLPERSQESVKMYGEGISGMLGWDLLKTLPFILDEPALQLEWRRHATPAEGATRVPMIEKDGRDFIEITAGKGCKSTAILNSAEPSVSIRRQFLRNHADPLWSGPVFALPSTFSGHFPDDDELPLGKGMESLPSGRWLTVECAGLKHLLPASINQSDEPSFGNMEIGYGWLRQVRVVFDGPGKALWLTPAVSTPEVELVRKGRPTPSKYMLDAALRMAISFNDPAAVKALLAAGADVKGPPEQSPLATACAFGSRGAALALLEAGAPVDSDAGGKISETPLIYACSSGDPALIEMLLKKGANPDRANPLGCTPLLAAVRTGGPAAVQALRGKARFPKDSNQAVGILGAACTGGNLPLAKEMLAQIPDKMRANIPWPVPLEMALLCGHEEIVDWLLKTGGPGLASKGVELHPLLAAILPVRIEKSDAIRERLVTKLLAAGADPNASRKGITPLLLAARHGTTGIVKALLAAGAKTANTDNKMRNALLRAATANQASDLMAPLLKSDIDLNAVDSDLELSALGIYAMHGNLEACTALLTAGADPNAKSPFGFTPLVVAANGSSTANEDNLAVFSLLLKHGAKPEAADNTKPGMLFGAIAMRRSTLIKPLVDAGAPVNQEMYHKIKPLALAAAVSDLATLQALLDLGADPKALDVKGISPLAHAAAAGRTNSMALLLAHGAAPDATGPSEIPPVWVAASGGQLRAVRALLASGANPNTLNPQTKTTALDVAKSRADQPMVTLLENHPRNK